MLNPNEPRCQGRLVRAAGSATLARECTNCERRTDVPADVKSVTWMQPPPVKPLWFLSGDCPCPSHVAPDVDVEVD